MELTYSLVTSTDGCRQPTCQVPAHIEGVLRLIDGWILTHHRSFRMIAGGVPPERGRTNCIRRNGSVLAIRNMLQWVRLMCSATAYACLQSQEIGSLNIMTDSNQCNTNAIKLTVLEL